MHQADGHGSKRPALANRYGVLRRALAGNETANYECSLVTRGGERVSVLLNATTRRDAARSGRVSAGRRRRSTRRHAHDR